MKVLIGTPAYGGMVHLGYMNSILEYQKQGLPFSLASFGNESLITRARNSIISYFYHHREEYTHLLFLDADIHLPASDLKAMMDFNKHVCGALAPVKAYEEDGRVRTNASGALEALGNGLYKAEFVATAALLLSQEAATAVVEEARSAGRCYQNPRGFDLNQTVADLEMYDVFQVGVVNDQYLSEDYWLCRTLSKLGFEIFATDIPKITHFGTHGFKARK